MAIVGHIYKPSDLNSENKDVRIKVTQVGMGRVYYTYLRTDGNCVISSDSFDLYYEEVKQMNEQDRVEAIQFFEDKLKSESEDNKFYSLALEALRKHSVLMNITDKLEEMACDEPDTSKAQGLCLAADKIDEMVVNVLLGCED